MSGMKWSESAYTVCARVGLIAAVCAAAPRQAAAQTTTTGPTQPVTRPALAPADPSATKLTLHLAGVPRTTAFAELSAASGMGNPVGDPGRNEPLITVDADDQPYWNVLLAIIDQSKGVDLASRAVGLRLDGASSDALAGMRSMDGAFVLSLNTWDRTVQFTGPAAPTRQATLEADIAYEPRLDVLYLDRTVAPAVAVDENGLSLVPRDDDRQPPRAFNGDSSNPFGQPAATMFAPLTINVNIPATTGRRVARLQMTVRAWLAQESRTFRCDYNQTVIDTGGPLPCKVSWDGSPDAPQVDVHFDRGSIKPETWQNMAAFLSVARIRVIDDTGADWRTDGGHNNGDYQDDQMTIHRVFNRPPPPPGQPAAQAKSKPSAAIVEFPVAVKPIELHFSFKDIPVP
jgi:hypothetical protein